LLIGKRRSVNVRGRGGAGVAFAILIAGSRVLGVIGYRRHRGLVLGWAWFAVCSLAFGGRFLRFGAPIEAAEAAAAPPPEETHAASRCMQGSDGSTMVGHRAGLTGDP
jgi:hypothetical protein